MTLSNIWYDIRSLLSPRHCLVCRTRVDDPTSMICPNCFSMISITRFWNYSDNAMAERARDLQPMVEEGCALLFYDSYSRPVIHNLKYYRDWRGAIYLGELLGAYLRRSELYQDIDVVVPVPIHPLRRWERTYNQSEHIASGIAKVMSLETNFHSLYRANYRSPQAGKSRVERWDDDNGGFAMRDDHKLDGKHILLVDDVYTTGATMYRCIEVILSSVPNCRISIATLAATGVYRI